jgi:hypothetical protein
MNLSLSNMLGGGSLTLDPDARAYIAAVETAGGTVSATQRTAVSDFYRAGKSAGWYSSIKRLYLPIWAAAAPNAIDMIGLTSGTFNGTVTHSAGYVEGDGTTGYFNTGATPASIGLSGSSAHFCFGSLTDFTNVFPKGGIGGNGSGPSAASDFVHSSVNGLIFRWSGTGVGQVNVNSARQGILTASREGGDRRLAIRTTASRTLLANTAGADNGSIPNNNVFFLAVNNTSVSGATNPNNYNDGQAAFYSLGLGLTDAQDTAYTLALKTLWESTTGLTLP